MVFIVTILGVPLPISIVISISLSISVSLSVSVLVGLPSELEGGYLLSSREREDLDRLLLELRELLGVLLLLFLSRFERCLS